MTRASLDPPRAVPFPCRLDDPDDDLDDDFEDEDEDEEEPDEDEEPWGDEADSGPEWQVTDGLSAVARLT